MNKYSDVAVFCHRSLAFEVESGDVVFILPLLIRKAREVREGQAWTTRVM